MESQNVWVAALWPHDMAATITTPNWVRIKTQVNIESLYFVFPGLLDTQTGGYHYDRRLIEELRKLDIKVNTISLSTQFPFPDAATLAATREALAAVPDGAFVIFDGLAYGVLDELAEAESQRLHIIALCHHPLALESGLDPVKQQDFHTSEQRALAAARHIIVTSEHTRSILTDQFDVSANKVLVAVPGTDRVPFAPCAGNPLQLLTVASLTRRKAHDVLINALANLVDLPWQARFVGGRHFDPIWSDQLQQQVNHLHLQKRIELAGTVDELDEAFHQADLFVLPSRFEGYGMVFAEALAAGLPIVAARAGAVPDVVPESAGILVPPDDVESLTTALRHLITNSELRQQLQAGAQHAALSLPTWADAALLVADLIKELNIK